MACWRTSGGRSLGRGASGFRVAGFLVDDPGVLGAAALRAVDDERALAERDAGQAAGRDDRLLAAEDIGAKVDVAALEPVSAPCRRAREADRVLGYEVAGVRRHHGAEVGDLLPARSRADQHAVAAGLVGRLDDQLRDVLEDELPVGGLGREVGGHVRQDGLLVEVVFDDLRDVGVDHLVVGHAGPDGVGEGHVAGAVGRDESRDPEHRVGPEHGGIEEVVVYPAVDHVDRKQARRRAHEDAHVLDDQVAALDDRDAHLAREEAVLEVGAVVDARRHEDDVWLVVGPGRDVEERLEQHLRVPLDRAHPVALEEVRERAAHGRAVLHHVRDAGGAPQVVLEHEVVPVLVADQVRAADVDVDVMGHREVHELPAEVLGREDLRRRDDLVLDDLLLVVEVVEEEVERRDALDETRLELVPLLRGNDPGDEVEREDALRPLGVVVDGERHPPPQEREVHGGPAPLKLRKRERAKAFDEAFVVGTDIPPAAYISSKKSPGS